MLSNLTKGKEPIAVVATIHQPSIKVFNLFEKVYIISHQGRCIYDDSPLALVDHLSSHGVEMPKKYSPADFIIEIATGDHGQGILDSLATYHGVAIENEIESSRDSSVVERSIAEIRAMLEQHPIKKHVWFHFQRNILTTLRDPLVFMMRFGGR